MADAIGAWRLRDVAPGEAPEAMPRGGGDGWIAAEAPGDTYRALVAAGRLADPYAGRNEVAAAWVRDREWWWHAPLHLEARGGDDRVELVFDGLDTFADVYLDGALLGRADNMFRAWRFDLTAAAPGAHDLAIRFHPATAMTGDAPLPTWASFTDRISRSRRTLMRKAQFGWGWDWGPDLPTVGIWRPVRIERVPAIRVARLGLATRSIGAGSAAVTATVTLTAGAVAEIRVTLRDPDGTTVASGTRRGSGTIDLAVPAPRLWWTADLGDQPLYRLVAEVAGAAPFVRAVGIRTVALDQTPDPDGPGAAFRFVLNGVPLFAKGANWVPASSFVGAIPDDAYRDLLARAVAANMNMVRVWGGGLYEPDRFYDECDRLGLLVWQDFMFACAPYPDDVAFAANVRAEVAEQVARLAHHPCLALWCGNNENQAIQWFDDLATGTPTPLTGLSLYEKLIPDVLAALDPVTPYWPSSPWGGPSPNSMQAGDVHDWTVWHGIPPVPDADPVGGYGTGAAGLAYTRYAENRARFVSEFGIQAAPDIATLRRWMAPEDLALGSDGFLERIKDVADKLSALMEPVTGPPATLEQYVDFSQLTQAEGLTFGIEHFRRNMPHCSGALIWQHNDCWPCVSWSLLDYDGVAKASFYAVARAFAPVMASFRRVEGAAELWLVNDTRATVVDTAVVAVARFDGGTEPVAQVPVAVPAHTSVLVWRGEVRDAADRALTVRSAGGLFAGNRLLLAPARALALHRDPGLTLDHERVGAALRVTISARRYAMALMVRSDDPALRFDANHLDLAGGEVATVTVTHRDGEPVTPEAVIVSSWNERAPV